MEKWDIYDENRVKTGDTINRGDQLNDNQYHLVVHVCIFNDQGQMLIQQRAENKQWGGLWDFSSGGAVIEGESSRSAAERECFEELGLKINLKEVRPNITIHFDEKTDRGFDDYYLLSESDTKGNIVFNKEIQKTKWADLNEIISMIRSGEFIGFKESFIMLLFDLRGSHTTHLSTT